MRTVLLMALLAAPGVATAQEGTAPDWANKTGGVGIGANTTVGGVNGLSIRTYVSPLFGIQATIGFSFSQTTSEPDSGGGDTISFSDTQILIGVYGSYKLAYWQRGHLSVPFGLDVINLSAKVDTPVGDYEDDATDVLLGLGLMGEWFPTQYLSLHLETGIRLDFIGPDEINGGTVTHTDDDTEYSGIDISLGGDLWGGAGFTVWFN